MKIDLTGKTAVVTGSTQGIGFAIAKGLSKAGATVVVNGRTEAKVAAAVQRLGGHARGNTADLGTAEGCAILIAAQREADIVVHNLGVFTVSDFFDTPDTEWDGHWQVNVMAGVRLARAYLPGMEQVGWGRLIFISPESLARGLAKRMAGTGVTVNSILPGPTLSEGVVSVFESGEGQSGRSVEEVAASFVKEHRSSSIIRRAATVEEVANMVVYVASPQASATTGAALRVDGGVIDTLM
jgi:NAD(P)-dependent dehydrogenase (short-subunit alcohol dehydrogenase family)